MSRVAAFAKPFAEPVGGGKYLCIVRRCCHVLDGFLCVHVAVNVLGEFVWEVLKILSEEASRLVLRCAADVGRVVVPVEEGASFFLQECKKLMFYAVQHVESYEDVAVVFVGKLQAPALQSFQYLPVQCALVRESVGLQCFVQFCVYLADMVPEGIEFCPYSRRFFFAEVDEEAFQGFALLGSERRAQRVRQVMVVGDVYEEAACVGEVFVHVVEVGEQALSPSVEVVQRF